VNQSEEEAAMPTRGDRRLKLVRGAVTSGTVVPSRPLRRRTVTRRVPQAEDPVAAILKRLDTEPVGSADPTGPLDLAQSREPAEPIDLAEVGGRVKRPGGGEADDAEGVLADEGAASTDPSRRPRLGLALGTSRLTVAGLVVALLAAVVLAGIFGRQWYEDRALAEAHQQALAAAKQTTVNFVSVSASSVDRDLQRITAGATGEFKEQFTRGETQVRSAVVENKVESKGTVLRAALVSGDRRSAVVLVAVDATVKNVHAPAGRPAHYRIQVDVTRDPGSGKWLVSRLQFVG
jgi:Mce-associated membrane protein